MSGISMESSLSLLRMFLMIRYWQQLMMAVRVFARVIWIHAKEREGELEKEDLLSKLFFPSPKQAL
jgi:ion channel-forming bestrophin family protein